MLKSVFKYTVRNFFIMISFLLLLCGCKKYPDGGYLVGLSKTQGKISGSWAITELKVNGIDTSLAGNINYCSSAPHITFEISELDEKKTLKSVCNLFPSNSWKVANDQKKLIITFDQTALTSEMYPIAVNNYIEITWEIQRLTKDDFWLKTTLNSRMYYLKLAYFR